MGEIYEYEEYDQSINDGGRLVRFIWCSIIDNLNIGDVVVLNSKQWQVIGKEEDKYIVIIEL